MTRNSAARKRYTSLETALKNAALSTVLASLVCWASASAWPPTGFDQEPAGPPRLVKMVRWSGPEVVEQLTALAISPDGRLVATQTSGGTVSIWDVASGQRRAKIAVQPDATRAGMNRFEGQRNQVFAFLVGGEVLGYEGNAATINLWDVARGRERAAISVGYPFETALVSPNGRYVAVEGPGVRVWDAAVGREKVWL